MELLILVAVVLAGPILESLSAMLLRRRKSDGSGKAIDQALEARYLNLQRQE